MAKYYYEISIGFAGMDKLGAIETDLSDNEILEWLREEAIEHAMSYGFEQDEMYFGDLDQVGSEWDEDEQCYLNEGYLEYWYEDYNEEAHASSITYGYDDQPEFETI